MTPDAFLAALTPRLRAYLHARLGNLADADDVLQTAFIRYMERGPQPGTAHAEAWLFTACRNEAMNLRRGDRRRSDRERGTATAVADAGPEAQALRGEAMERIASCLQNLPEDQREMVYLNIVERRSMAELAELTGVPRSTVALRVQEGLVLLSRCFHSEGA